MLATEGEDWSVGPGRASALYHARAAHKTSMLLFAALPVSILAIAVFLMAQLLPYAHAFTSGFSFLFDFGF